ncbi:phosphatase PAP2 family protein [Pseudalkalibacillus caeni]|uniref:Phosphatase PAP2 family protein n=1 Tax=Exobacillus caeni TaxID=2574798 RepID=A0A5R9F9V8_9BACL|nr:phosphatase PAP2 family protein [Pseudalkalibacillus caeni]TLS39030.1 phosphatase PAP2 family protein [Pseudalkalibacillus caeni]
MTKVIGWLYEQECFIFRLVNKRFQHSFLTFLLSKLTHLGGSRFMVAATLSVCFLAPSFGKAIGYQSAAALAASHIPVQLLKRKYPRNRPYTVLPDTKIEVAPLKDYSFPSGHTTAVFSVVTPFIISIPSLSTPFLILAFAVAFSRIYLGHHYPSDVVAGMILGTAFGILASSF